MKLSSITKENLKDLYDSLGSLKVVSRYLQCDSGTIKRKMIEYNLSYKTKVINTCDDDFFSRDNEESFYIAGFIAADGCIKRKKCLSISLSNKDIDFLFKIKEKLKSTSIIHTYKVKNSKRNVNWNDTIKCEISITSDKICKDLLRFNITPRKTLTYSFPDWLKSHPLKHHFIRGYNDGDGCFYISKNNKTVKQLYFSLRGTESFLFSVREILEKECLLNKRTSKIRISSGCGILEYGGNNILLKIVNFLYNNSTIYMERKYKITCVLN